MSLYVDKLSKAFAGNKAVDELSFEMDEPGVFGLIGTNGAGKTTTIRMILGILRSDSGSALWDGRAITRDTLRFGYMPEERGIYMKTKVLEQLIYFGMLRGMPKAEAKKSALHYLERLGMSEYAEVPAEKLSKGNQQKIQLIMTLIHDPLLIFLDEPFSGLDPLNVEVLSGVIKELVSKGCYVVMSSHQMATVEQFCENLVILNKGKTVLSGNLSEIKAGYGRTNLVVSCDGDITGIAKAAGLRLLEKRPRESEYKIDGDGMANAFLSELISKGLFPTKYEIREPSLQEIFIEKVGEGA